MIKLLQYWLKTFFQETGPPFALELHFDSELGGNLIGQTITVHIEDPIDGVNKATVSMNTTPDVIKSCLAKLNEIDFSKKSALDCKLFANQLKTYLDLFES